MNTTETQATETTEVMAGNFYGGATTGMPYQQYQPQAFGYGAPAPMYQPQQAQEGVNPAYFQGAGYTAADPSAFGYGAQPQQPTRYSPYGYQQPGSMYNYAPATVIRGTNNLPKEDIEYIKSQKDLDVVTIKREDDIQARCMHKEIEGQNQGLIAGGEIPGIPGSWHCPVCEAKWMVANCSSGDFDKLLSAVWNIIQTDKCKMTNISQGMVDGVLKALPALKLLSKVHRIAESDFNKSQSAMKSKFTASPAWGGSINNSAWLNTAATWLNTAATSFGGNYYQAPFQGQQPTVTPSYGYNPQAAPAPYGAPMAPAAGFPYGQPTMPMTQPGCAGSPLVGGAPAAPAAAPTPIAPAPAAPAYQPVQQAGAPDVAGATATTEQKI